MDVVDGIKAFIEHSDRLTDDQQAALVKLLWLLGQAPEYARQGALAKIEPLLERADTALDEFMEAVLAASLELAQAINREPF